jgi:hypothetical protein
MVNGKLRFSSTELDKAAKDIKTEKRDKAA